MLKTKLKSIIPKNHNSFSKLTGGSPYYFDAWKNDRKGKECLYYWFWGKKRNYKNRKRVRVKEIHSALIEMVKQGVFDRDIFNRMCKVSNSDGPCGLAVIGRCFEYLGLAKFMGARKGFQLTNAAGARKLISVR